MITPEHFDQVQATIAANGSTLLACAIFPQRGISPPFAIVLVERSEAYADRFVTWSLNLEDGYLYGGDYLNDQAAAWRSFHERQAPEIACYE